jgi:predicted outer membrane protein
VSPRELRPQHLREGSNEMSLRNPLKTAATAAGLFGLLAAYTVAQQATRQLDRPQTQPPERSATRQIDRDQSGRVTTQYGQRDAQGVAGASTQEVENYLANCLLMRNQAEIEIAEFAQQQLQNPEAKQFAQKLIQDHGQLVQKLQPLAAMFVTGPQRSATRVDSRQLDAQRGAADTTRLPGSPGAAINNNQPNQGLTATQPQQQGQNAALQHLAQLERQIGERCKQALKEELQAKTGADFEKCFVGAMIGSHMQSLAALEVIGQQTQGQLAEVAQQAQPIVQQHLDHAKQLAKQLEGARPGTQAERQQPSRTQR